MLRFTKSLKNHKKTFNLQQAQDRYLFKDPTPESKTVSTPNRESLLPINPAETYQLNLKNLNWPAVPKNSEKSEIVIKKYDLNYFNVSNINDNLTLESFTKRRKYHIHTNRRKYRMVLD